MKIRVTVPASAGNTGSAFDSLGIAYGLENEVVFDTSAPPGRVDAEGEGADLLRRGEANLVHAALERFSRETGKALPPLGMTLVNRIPFGRGLGSSAAAIVAGLVGADALLGTGMSREALLRLAIPMEGHPDNVAPALFGGAVLTVLDEGRVDGPVTVVPFSVDPDWRAVLYVPDQMLPTQEARAILPREVPRADAVFNHSRVGLLVAALERRRPDLLRIAMQDRLHQPYRVRLFPPMEALIRAALDAGAWGACLSGAGSAVLALVSEARAGSVENAFRAAAETLKVPGRTLRLEIPAGGARVLPA
jgi:homoserine kinase